jgi:hypothetical protein
MRLSSFVFFGLTQSDDTPFWIKAITAFAFIGAAVWMHRSSSKRPFADIPPPLPGPTHEETPSSTEEASTSARVHEQSVIQKAFAFPGIGGWLRALVGFVIPFILFSILLQPLTHDDPYAMAYLFAAMSVWNLFFTAIVRVRITLFFIPAWIVCLIGLAYSIYEVKTQHSP